MAALGQGRRGVLYMPAVVDSSLSSKAMFGQSKDSVANDETLVDTCLPCVEAGRERVYAA